MTPFLPLAATEVVAVTRRAVSGAQARDEVEPARQCAPGTAREPDRRRPRRLARLNWLLPALGR
jgi:hypothetical protein